MGRSCLPKWWTGTIDQRLLEITRVYQRLLEKAHGGTQVVRTLEGTLPSPAIATIHTPSEGAVATLGNLIFVTLYGNYPGSRVWQTLCQSQCPC